MSQEETERMWPPITLDATGPTLTLKVADTTAQTWDEITPTTREEARQALLAITANYKRPLAVTAKEPHDIFHMIAYPDERGIQPAPEPPTRTSLKDRITQPIRTKTAATAPPPPQQDEPEPEPTTSASTTRQQTDETDQLTAQPAVDDQPQPAAPPQVHAYEPAARPAPNDASTPTPPLAPPRAATPAPDLALTAPLPQFPPAAPTPPTPTHDAPQTRAHGLTVLLGLGILAEVIIIAAELTYLAS